MAAPGLKVATGVLLSEDRLTVTTVAKTPMGARQLAAQEVPLDGDDVAATLRRLRAEGALKGRIVCGVDARRAFAITCRLDAEDAKRPPAELLSARLGYLEGGLAAGMEPVRLPSGPHVSLVACSRGLASELLTGLADVPLSSVRLAPVMHALFALAQQKKALPRRWKTEVRVLLGEREGLAVLAHQGHPVASRLFDCPAGGALRAMDVAVLSLTTYAREELDLGPVDGVLVHVPERDGESVAEAAERSFGLTTIAAPPLAPDEHTASHALGLLALRSRPGAIDLFRDLHPPAGLRQNFPVRAALLMASVLAAGAWLVHDEAVRLERETERLERAVQANAKKAGASVPELRKIHEARKAEMKIARSFVERRVFWSDLLAALPAVLPSTVQLTDFDGRDLLRFNKAKGTTTSRQLRIIGQVAMEQDDVSPPEVAELTDALRSSPVFAAQFPLITGANVRLMPGMQGLFARLSILCLPQGE